MRVSDLQTMTPGGRAFSRWRRRDLLAGLATTTLVAGGAAYTGKLLANPVSTPPPAAFVTLTRFVTGSNITDPVVLTRAWSQLVALDGGFPAAVGRLRAAIDADRLADMTAFLASPRAKDAALMATARTITAAWYLGYTGTIADHTVKDDTGFITFAGALMWRPTIDATVIPTYARGATDFWIEPPAGTPIPKGPQGVPDWQGATPAASSKDA